MSCSPEVVSWQDECYEEAGKGVDEEAALTLVALSQTPVERHDEGGINVEFIKHTNRRGGAPLGSKGRDLYRFSANGFRREEDCWHWWRGDDNIVRILGGGRPKKPTIYYFKVKGEKLSCCLDKDQSKAWEIYNQYGR